MRRWPAGRCGRGTDPAACDREGNKVCVCFVLRRCCCCRCMPIDVDLCMYLCILVTRRRVMRAALDATCRHPEDQDQLGLDLS